MSHARIVDDGVDQAEALFGGVVEGDDRRLVGDIAADRHGPVCADLLHEIVEPILAARSDDDPRTFARQHQGEASAEPAGCAGYQSDASFKPARHCRYLLARFPWEAIRSCPSANS